MKTSLKQVFAVGAIVCLGMLGCKKDDTIFNVAVYTTLDTTQVYELYVDGDAYGVVPSLTGPISCDSTERLVDCLNFSLPAGRHVIDMWNESGASVSRFKLKIYENSTGGSSGLGDNGGNEAFVNGTCVVIKLF